TSLVAVITVTIGVLTNNRGIANASNQVSRSIEALAMTRHMDASADVAKGIEAYIVQMQLASQAIGVAVSLERVSYDDPDVMLPFFKETLWKFGISDRITVFGTSSLSPRNSIWLGKNAIVHDAGYSLGLIIQTTNSSCQNFCPVKSTNSQIQFYGLDPITLNIQRFIIGLPIPVDPTSFSALPQNTPVIGNPRVYPDEIVQPLYMGLYNNHGVQVGSTYIAFSVQEFSNMLDSVKQLATPNSLFYVVSSMGDVLAISGLGNSSVQSQTLKKLIDPSQNYFALNSVFDYDFLSFPMLNLSASAILKYVGGDLSSEFPDRAWQDGANLFCVRTIILWGYRLFNRPVDDYLGETVNLIEGNLKNEGTYFMIQVIFAALGVVMIMSLSAIIFVYIFIAKPLSNILLTMNKATKFDFSDLHDGKLKSLLSIVNEIHHLQANFTQMVKVFAMAIK
ncbi:hypothetical protein HDU93_000366, partial [Gonapodya sp. JEL0774]